jgi:hypothetical protein
MMRVLLDENIPAGLQKLLPGHEAKLPTDVGLAGVSNGELLTSAEREGFDVLVTADRNLSYQQNLTGRAISIVVLDTNHWGTIRQDAARVVDAVNRCTPGSFIEIAFDRLQPREKGRGPRFDL